MDLLLVLHGCCFFFFNFADGSPASSSISGFLDALVLKALDLAASILLFLYFVSEVRAGSRGWIYLLILICYRFVFS